MFATGTMLLVATLAAPGPVKPKKEAWIGVAVCCKPGVRETYRRKDDGTFELQPFGFRYLDVRVVDEQGEYVALQHDSAIVWIKKEGVLRPQDAIDHFTADLDKNPQNDHSLACRCWAFMAAGDYDRALLDAEEAVRLSPNSIAWKNNRGEVLIKKKEYEKAATEFSDILTTNPGFFFALFNRGEAYLRNKQFDKALADIDLALQTEPSVPGLHMNQARVLATAPDAKLRDGKRALSAALKAREMTKWRDGRTLDTLAAAYAETGDFDKAVEVQQQAFDDSDFMRDEGVGARKRLKLYREKKPFRDE